MAISIRETLGRGGAGRGERAFKRFASLAFKRSRMFETGKFGLCGELA